MAHFCPECAQTCYCGGDIDDLLFDYDSDGAIGCTHCSDAFSGFDDDYLLEQPEEDPLAID